MEIRYVEYIFAPKLRGGSGSGSGGGISLRKLVRLRYRSLRISSSYSKKKFEEGRGGEVNERNPVYSISILRVLAR